MVINDNPGGNILNYSLVLEEPVFLYLSLWVLLVISYVEFLSAVCKWDINFISSKSNPIINSKNDFLIYGVQYLLSVTLITSSEKAPASQ